MQRFLLASFVMTSVVISLSGTHPPVLVAQAVQQAAPAIAAVPSASPAANHTVIPAVPYAHPDGVELVADMYLPAGPGPFPAVVFIHGGGWSSGDRTQLRRQAAYMAERGMVGMAIDYRLAPGHPFPAALEDSREAVRWLRQHASTYKVDTAHIGTVGSSAGAHLAAMLGVESAGNANPDTGVQAVVALNGIFDLEKMPATEMISGLVGKPCAEAIDLCRAASPIDQIRSGAPPFLVVHGDADETAPYSQAEAFVRKLVAAHDSAEFVTIAGGPHTFWSKPKWSQASNERMAAFLTKTLRP